MKKQKAATPVVSVDFSKKIGKIKPLHGAGQGPILGWSDFSMFHYLKEAGVPFARLHDTGGAFGKNLYVDIPNVFRDFDANPYDPANYDFAFTDKLMEALVENGVEPYYRLGVTIENKCDIKAYRIFPPKDNLQWARICEGIIRHYTEGWGNGYKMNISHWEIWNEPENDPDPMVNHMWRGTFEQYLELYNTASKYLKGLFPHLKIGGYASCGFYAMTRDKKTVNPRVWVRYEFLNTAFLQFVEYVKANKCPLDFFSFHCYDDVRGGVKHIAFVRKTLDDAGFKDTELSLNEWLPSTGETGSVQQAAYIAAMLAGMQNSGVIDDSEIYDARCGMGRYSPLFHPVTYQPRPAYYTLFAFNELYKRKNAVATSGAPEDVWVTAAKGPRDGAVYVANITGKEVPLSFDFGGKKVVSCKIVDETHTYEEVALPAVLPKDSFLLIIVK
ncbi:MAG: hypothetical protein J6X55_02190 [Victivallales bacterium]|nr:hypothetical protein [Victivallales bacterium]